MNTLQHTVIKLLSLTVGVISLLATVSCSRDEDATRGGGRRELAVNVEMQNSDWQTRSDDGIANSLTDNSQVNVPENIPDNAHDSTQVLGSAALDEQLEVVTEYEPIGYAPEAPLTRGTPVVSASNLQSMGFSVYINSVFSKTLSATNNGSSWVVADNIALNLDNNKYSYYAYAPVAAADNGIVLQADGKKLTYTAPVDITKQPDLCWAKPITEDKTGTANFEMQHALTAVGIKVRADNVEIKSIKLMQVQTSGTLDLVTGAWTVSDTPKNDLEFTLSNNKPATGDGVVNITTSDGYLMLPPQALTTDTKKLVIEYRYTSGTDTDWHTGTHQLSSLTGNNWLAGQRVNYVIQLKANFALTLSPASATVLSSTGKYTLNYTTSSSASTSRDPIVTCSDNDGWIYTMTVYRTNGSGTINFNYERNNLKFARKTSFTVTSGFTTKTFEFKQLASFDIRLSSATPPGDVYRSGGSYTTNVITPSGVAWKVATMKNCLVSPMNGSDGATVTITVPPTTAERDIRVSFSTNIKEEGISELTADWAGKQINVPDGCWPTPLQDHPNVYVLGGDIPGGTLHFQDATNACKSLGGRLPNLKELQMMAKNRDIYSIVNRVAYWSSDPASNGWHKCWHFYFDREEPAADTGWGTVRCLKEI